MKIILSTRLCRASELMAFSPEAPVGNCMVKHSFQVLTLMQISCLDFLSSVSKLWGDI